MALVYKVTNKINGVSYIGATKQSLRERCRQHWSEAKREYRPGSLLHRALRNDGAENFEWRVLCEVTDEELHETERRYIAAARQCGKQLYNVTGGPGSLGVNKSQDLRDRISKAKMGQVPHNKGIPHSTETLTKISAALRGRTLKPRRIFQGKTFAEWASELGISYVAVKSRIHRHSSPFGRKP